MLTKAKIKHKSILSLQQSTYPRSTLLKYPPVPKTKNTRTYQRKHAFNAYHSLPERDTVRSFGKRHTLDALLLRMDRGLQLLNETHSSHSNDVPPPRGFSQQGLTSEGIFQLPCGKFRNLNFKSLFPKCPREIAAQSHSCQRESFLKVPYQEQHAGYMNSKSLVIVTHGSSSSSPPTHTHTNCSTVGKQL